MDKEDRRRVEREKREAKILEAEFMLLEDEVNGLPVQAKNGVSTDLCHACTSMPPFSERVYESPRVVLRLKFCTACKRQERNAEIKTEAKCDEKPRGDKKPKEK